MVKHLAESTELQDLIDVFYFEHHVIMKEMKSYWWKSWEGSVEDSLKLFSHLRKKGVAAHYWP
jgi:hypothetical protein